MRQVVVRSDVSISTDFHRHIQSKKKLNEANETATKWKWRFQFCFDFFPCFLYANFLFAIFATKCCIADCRFSKATKEKNQTILSHAPKRDLLLSEWRQRQIKTINFIFMKWIKSGWHLKPKESENTTQNKQTIACICRIQSNRRVFVLSTKPNRTSSANRRNLFWVFIMTFAAYHLFSEFYSI